MSKDNLTSLLTLLSLANNRPIRPETKLEEAKQAVTDFCNGWIDDFVAVVDAKNLKENKEYNAILGFVLRDIHGLNSARFMNQDTKIKVWKIISANEDLFNFIHSLTSHMTNCIAPKDATGWAELFKEIAIAESSMSESVAEHEKGKVDNLYVLPSMDAIMASLQHDPWYATVYVLYRCRYTQLFIRGGIPNVKPR